MRKALGRGLEALIPALEKESEKVVSLEIEAISENRYQPRVSFDEAKLEELANSLREKGVIQPVIVRVKEEGYELIAGERRLQAAKIAGMKTVPAIVRSVNDREMLEISLVENIQRDDLNSLEEAAAYRQLIDEFGLTQEGVAEEVGKDRATVANTIRLLNLSEEVQGEIRKNKISRGPGIVLLGVADRNEQVRFCMEIVRRGLSVRESEVLVTRALTRHRRRTSAARKSPEIAAIEEKLQHFFGTRVYLKNFKKGGRIEIEYYSDEDLNRVLELLGVVAE